ncbi:hypothetical protein EDC94DRAFT_628822, partial [Helicostylum pulchrum]
MVTPISMATGVLCLPPFFYLIFPSFPLLLLSFFSLPFFFFFFTHALIHTHIISMYNQYNNKRKRQCLPSISQLLPSPPLSSHTFYSYYKPEYIYPPPTFFFDLTDSIINDTQVLEDASFFFFGQIRTTPSPSASTTHKRKRDFILVDTYHHEPSTKEKLIPDLIQP